MSTSPSTIRRLQRLVRLDLRVLDELRSDPGATVPAIVCAVVGMLGLGLGGWFWWLISGLGDAGPVFIKTVILGSAFGLAAWLVWLIVAYLALRRLSQVTLPIDQLLRLGGVATAPLILGLAMAIPAISFGVGLVALAAWVTAMQIAVERTVGRGGGDVWVANLAGFGAWLVIMSLLASGANQLGPGPFLAESLWDAVTQRNVILQ